MKVLIVDDEKFNLVVANDLIAQSDIYCETILCSNPWEVADILNSNNIDIILLDINMPVLTGIDLIRRIRENSEYRTIQILMLTANTDQESFKTCFELGANDYILKPINPVEFSARLKAAINTRTNTIMLKEMLQRMKEQNIELKEVNQKLKDAQFHMIQKEKLASIGELAAGVAHEINNPIGFIGSNLETLGVFVQKINNVIVAYRELVERLSHSEGCLELTEPLNHILELEKKNKLDFILSELDGVLGDSRDGIERVAKIVGSLRSFARSGMEDTMEANDLNKIIEQAMLIVRNEAKYSVDIETKLDLIPDVTCNGGQIGQVVLNLLVNAVQAIKEQERKDRGRIIISTYKENDYVCCRVEDDGPGIDYKIISKIFDPFFTTKEVGKGTGLGLSISYDIIVKKHKGEFKVESEPGKGTVFTFKLPLVNEYP